jgi:hypothetical protein
MVAHGSQKGQKGPEKARKGQKGQKKKRAIGEAKSKVEMGNKQKLQVTTQWLMGKAKVKIQVHT